MMSAIREFFCRILGHRYEHLGRIGNVDLWQCQKCQRQHTNYVPPGTLWSNN